MEGKIINQRKDQRSLAFKKEFLGFLSKASDNVKIVSVKSLYIKQNCIFKNTFENIKLLFNVNLQFLSFFKRKELSSSSQHEDIGQGPINKKLHSNTDTFYSLDKTLIVKMPYLNCIGRYYHYDRSELS